VFLQDGVVAPRPTNLDSIGRILAARRGPVEDLKPQECAIVGGNEPRSSNPAVAKAALARCFEIFPAPAAALRPRQDGNDMTG
jgi:hypothetical protein